MANEEYIKGFNTGKGLGFQLGKIQGIVSVHLGWAMGKIFLIGVTLGYIVGKFLGK